MAITKALFFVMATVLIVMSSMITAQVPTSSAPKIERAVSQPRIAAEASDAAENDQRSMNPVAARGRGLEFTVTPVYTPKRRYHLAGAQQVYADV
jgi:hypothetical protein